MRPTHGVAKHDRAVQPQGPELLLSPHHSRLSIARKHAVAVPEPCRVALVGFGTVGSALARLLEARAEELPLRLTHISNRNVARKRAGWATDAIVWTENLHDVLQADVDVVVELMGGLDPAYELVRGALACGKSVVTANKQLIAHFGSELLQLAADNGRFLGIGACVAGGVPVLSALQDGLAGDRILQVRGILNGTCNYILSRIEQGGASFADALAEAQRAGFAEADPSFDVDGQDAAAKLAILARVGLKADVLTHDVSCRSIRPISAVDFEYAHELDCSIRQVATAAFHDGKLYLEVGPCLVSKSSPFAKVAGSQNLVASTGEFGGETTFGGFGAGGDPTAVAVLSDLIQAANHRLHRPAVAEYSSASRYELTRSLELAHYLRFVVRDRPGIVASLASVFADCEMNLNAILQKPGYDKSSLPFVVTLEPCRHEQLSPALEEIRHFDFLVEPPLAMPIVQKESQ